MSNKLYVLCSWSKDNNWIFRGVFSSKEKINEITSQDRYSDKNETSWDISEFEVDQFRSGYD